MGIHMKVPVLIALVVALHTNLISQEAPRLAPGNRVRVSISRSTFLFTSPFKAETQERARLIFGSRVRVLTSKYVSQGKIHIGKYESLVGSFLAMTSDTLLISDDRGDSIHCPLASVSRLELSQGQKWKTGKGALIGFGVGAVLGGLIVGIHCSTQDDCQTSTAYAAGAGIFGAAGTLIGAIAGGMIQEERWQEVPLR